MTATFSIIEKWRDWEPNPVLLKELRQAVRSRVLTGALLAVLAALFLTSTVYLVRADAQSIVTEQIGKTLFRIFLVMLTVISLVFVPIYTGIRLALERNVSDLDLIFITTLRPERIIRGKLFCGAYLVAMFFSVCAPFMIFTSLLRGVDLPTIVLILVYLFVSACLATELAICFA
ncbi:MAG TPA: hypothetical protein VK327_04535, partial [Candidatus Paceibacterota bacterium]|nr:hypothetical protein [Candidatus Paceibacterota bacterium]